MDLLSSQFLAPLHVTEARFHLTAALSNPGALRSSQWLTRCNFPYGKGCYYHSRQKYQSLCSSQCWNLAGIWIKELAYSASANRERARWTHTRLPWSFPLFIVSSFHSFVLNSSKGQSPRWDQEPSMLWRPLPEGSMGETTSRTAPSVLFALPVQAQQALSLQTVLDWQAHIRRVPQVLCHSARARLCGLQCHSCFTSASLSREKHTTTTPLHFRDTKTAHGFSKRPRSALGGT